MTARNRLFTIASVLAFCLVLGSPSFGSELDLSFDRVDFAEIFRILGESQGLNVLVDPEVSGQGSFQLMGVDFREALLLISEYSVYVYRLAGNSLLFAPPERFQEPEHK